MLKHKSRILKIIIYLFPTFLICFLFFYLTSNVKIFPWRSKYQFNLKTITMLIQILQGLLKVILSTRKNAGPLIIEGLSLIVRLSNWLRRLCTQMFDFTMIVWYLVLMQVLEDTCAVSRLSWFCRSSCLSSTFWKR